jgi:hypothetical protein
MTIEISIINISILLLLVFPLGEFWPFIDCSQYPKQKQQGEMLQLQG